MSKKSASSIPFDDIPVGPQRCRHVGNYVLDNVEKALLYAASQRHNALSAEEIVQILDNLRETPRGVWHFYQQSFDHCSRASKDAAQRGYERRNLLLRLIVGTFEHKFPATPESEVTGDMLSRAIIAPLEVVVEMMLGMELLKESKEACQDIFQELERALGDTFTWSAFYNDPRSTKVLLEACAAIARHFDDFEKRKAWFIDTLNKHTNSASAPDGGVEEFGENDFCLVVSCLMGKAHTLLQQQDEGAAAISQEDAENIENLYRQCQSA